MWPAGAACLQIVAFGSVSAMFNPAAALSQVVAGNLGPAQFFTVIAGEMVGAFLGGLTIFVLYMPQLYKAGAKVRMQCAQRCCGCWVGCMHALVNSCAWRSCA